MNKEMGKKPPKLLLDEHIWAYLAKILREQGFDVIHVNEVNLDATPKEHYGVVVSIELSHGELRRRVTKLLESVTAEELVNAVRYL